MHRVVVFTLPGSHDVDYSHVVAKGSNSFSYPVVAPSGCSDYHGGSSFTVICKGAVWLSHYIWNHSLVWKAPQPQLMIRSIPSAVAVKIMRAEWRVKERTLSNFSSPCHCMARSSLSSGATGTMRNASLTFA